MNPRTLDQLRADERRLVATVAFLNSGEPYRQRLNQEKRERAEAALRGVRWRISEKHQLPLPLA